MTLLGREHQFREPPTELTFESQRQRSGDVVYAYSRPIVVIRETNKHVISAAGSLRNRPDARWNQPGRPLGQRSTNGGRGQLCRCRAHDPFERQFRYRYEHRQATCEEQ
jgi:hypothetical protein